MTVLYYYNDFFKNLLFTYKGLYDYALKDAFFIFDLDTFRQRYSDYVIVVAPSDMSSNKIRGFAPNEAIAFTLSSHVFNGLYKTRKHKQSNLRYDERTRIKDVIDIKGGAFLRHQKILLFDDVITSSNTLRACLALIEQYEPECIEILVLATKQNQKDFTK